MDPTTKNNLNSIFKSYDVRGIYPTEIHEKIVYKIARALVTFLDVKEIVVGHDMRESSTTLLKAVERGIVDQGATVINNGLCSTPSLYFAARHKPAAIMITASHNPPEYNGLKLCRAGGIAISQDSGLKEIQELAERDNFSVGEKGRIITRQLFDDYIQHYRQKMKNMIGFHIVFDFGNGMAAKLYPKIMETIPGTYHYLNHELDGSFPARPSDPTKRENLEMVSKAIQEKQADLGVATDGDADRITILDERGVMIPGDILFALIIQQIAKKEEKFIYDVSASKIVKETIQKKEAIPIISKRGHSFMKELLKKEQAVMAGEKSGHYAFAAEGWNDAPLLALSIVLHAMKESGKKLSELIIPLLKYASSDEINITVENPTKVIEQLATQFNDGKQERIDGISIQYHNWWCNIRKSNTEPVVRINIEADDEETLEKKKEELFRTVVD